MSNDAKLTKDMRIDVEDNRLRAIFATLPPETFRLYDGLIKRAAVMRIMLEDFETDIILNGWVEPFSQSDKLASYDRERPAVRLYNTANKNYQCIMKQLKDALPDLIIDDCKINPFEEFVGG